MVMSGSHMSSQIESLGTPLGLLGDKFPDYCDAVGNGTVNAVVGAAFTTTDSGTGNGTGDGTGTGLTGVVASVLSAALLAGMTAAFGGAGPSLPSMCVATAGGFAAEVLLATLTSSHTPVHIGTGIVDIGSIAVAGGDISSSIEAEGAALDFDGDEWPNVADVIGTEYANSLLLASGIVIISGPGSGDTPGLVIPQGGSGTLS